MPVIAASVNDSVVFGQIALLLPVIADAVRTFTDVVVEQPVLLIVNVILATPAPMPVISPPAALAIVVLLLDHDAVPVVASLNIVMPPTHIVVVPSIAVGVALTVFKEVI